MKHRKQRKRSFTPRAALLAGALVFLGVSLSPATGASPQPNTGVGQVVTCQVDAGSGCTIQHGLGVKPAGVTATAGSKGQLVSIPPASTTATMVRVNFNWRDGTTFPAGTSFTFYIHYDLPASIPSPSPTATTPVETPPASTPPPVTTPPPTTPAPTPTDTASPAQTCTSPNFTTTSTNNQGDGVTYGKYFVHNNMWNNDNGTYTLKACSAAKWFELATQPKPSDNGVQTYPNVHKDYNDVALFNADGSPKIRSAKFAAATPATCVGCVYDVAFDIWLGPGLNNELMIWTDNKGQTPAGSKSVTPFTAGGQTYDVWHESGYTAYVSRTTQKYGTMPLGEILKDMNTRGWIPTKTTWQVDYGVEVVSTAGTQQRFDFTDFSIDDDY